MKKFTDKIKVNESKKSSENLKGFEKKLTEILNDSIKVDEIISLFPDSIIMPLFYKGDVVELNEGGQIEIVQLGWKIGGYIYYYDDEENGLLYTYEDDIKFD